MKSMIILALIFITHTASAEPVVGLKDFRSIYYSLAAVTEVRPTQEIQKYYQENMTKFPTFGRVEELSTSGLMALKGLAGLFCREFSRSYQAPGDLNSMLSDLSSRFYGRELSAEESRKMTELIRSSREENKPFLACTAMTSSLEFLVQ